LTDLLDNIKEITARIERHQIELREASKEAFKEGMRHFFEQYPFVAMVAWTQYTPWFNDGDPCEFGVHDFTFHTHKDVNGDDEEGGDSEAYYERYYEDGPEFASKCRKELYTGYSETERRSIYERNEQFDPQYAEAKETASKLLNAIPQDIYRSMFGDHVAVKVTRDGVDVEEYEHD
jgi:hypothetical protein